LYPTGTSIKVPANGWFPLFGPRREGPASPEPVQLGEPSADICDNRFEKNPFLHPADSNPIAFEAEFLGKADGLASAIFEQFRDFGLGHNRDLVYTNDIYQCKGQENKIAMIVPR
jgi:hypothetical protein